MDYLQMQKLYIKKYTFRLEDPIADLFSITKLVFVVAYSVFKPFCKTFLSSRQAILSVSCMDLIIQLDET